MPISAEKITGVQVCDAEPYRHHAGAWPRSPEFEPFRLIGSNKRCHENVQLDYKKSKARIVIYWFYLMFTVNSFDSYAKIVIGAVFAYCGEFVCAGQI